MRHIPLPRPAMHRFVRRVLLPQDVRSATVRATSNQSAPRRPRAAAWDAIMLGVKCPLAILVALTVYPGCDGPTLVLGKAPGLTDAGPVDAAAPRDASAPNAAQDARMPDARVEEMHMDDDDPPLCTSAADCADSGYPRCNVARAECVLCLVDADCDAGGRCNPVEGDCDSR